MGIYRVGATSALFVFGKERMLWLCGPDASRKKWTKRSTILIHPSHLTAGCTGTIFWAVLPHATMLEEQNIISPADRDAIVDGLNGILSDIEEGHLLFDPTAEDIHMFVEAELTRRIGDAGKAPSYRQKPQRSGRVGYPAVSSG